jgi:xylan 1,4-beta-xylosidase
LYLQKTGHGDIVQTQNGDWYVVFLVSRPLSRRGRCITGRETAIERVVWSEDGWLRLACGGNEPRQGVEAPDLPDFTFKADPERHEFDTPELDINFQSLRIPMTPDWINLTDRPGYLRLYGRESLNSTFRQSLVARRVQAHHTQSATCLEFEPVTFQQMAGLICYYNTYHYHYLHVFGDDDGTIKYLGILTNDKYSVSEPNGEPVEITGLERVHLKVDFNGADLQFYYAAEENQWHKIGPVLDGSILSDDYVEDAAVRYRPCFTGAFVGLCCQDLSGRNLPADFDWFEYRELD